jgi:hypothetical protein
MSLRLSLLAVRRCLQLRDSAAANMTPEMECRAWTAFVELGMKIVAAGLSGESAEGEEWARGLENEVTSPHRYSYLNSDTCIQIGAAIGKGVCFMLILNSSEEFTYVGLTYSFLLPRSILRFTFTSTI